MDGGTSIFHAINRALLVSEVKIVIRGAKKIHRGGKTGTPIALYSGVSEREPAVIDKDMTCKLL